MRLRMRKCGLLPMLKDEREDLSRWNLEFPEQFKWLITPSRKERAFHWLQT